MLFLHSLKRWEVQVLMASFLILIYRITNICRECCKTSPRQARPSWRSSTRFIPWVLPHLSQCPRISSHNRASARYPFSNPYPAVNSRSRFLSRRLEERMLKLTGQLVGNKIMPRFLPRIINKHHPEGPPKIYISHKTFKPGPPLIIIMNSSRNMCFNNSYYLSKSNKNYNKRYILK